MLSEVTMLFAALNAGLCTYVTIMGGWGGAMGTMGTIRNFGMRLDAPTPDPYAPHL